MRRSSHAEEVPQDEVAPVIPSRDQQDLVPDVSVHEAEPVKLSKQVLESLETAMHDKIWVGKVLSDKKLNKVRVKITILTMWEDGNRVPSSP